MIISMTAVACSGGEKEGLKIKLVNDDKEFKKAVELAVVDRDRLPEGYYTVEGKVEKNQEAEISLVRVSDKSVEELFSSNIDLADTSKLLFNITKDGFFVNNENKGGEVLRNSLAYEDSNFLKKFFKKSDSIVKELLDVDNERLAKTGKACLAFKVKLPGQDTGVINREKIESCEFDKVNVDGVFVTIKLKK